MEEILPAQPKQKLDFRFADADDAADLAELVNRAHQCECAPNANAGGSTTQPSSDVPSSSFPEHIFRKNTPKIHLQELLDDLNKPMTSTRWLVLETAAPEEVMVAAARLRLHRSDKGTAVADDMTGCWEGEEGAHRASGRVDILCALGDSELARRAVLRLLLSKVEQVAYHSLLGSQQQVQQSGALLVEVAQWRADMEALLMECGYVERSGRQWPQSRHHELLKPTMLLEFHKNFYFSRHTQAQAAPSQQQQHPLFADNCPSAPQFHPYTDSDHGRRVVVSMDPPLPPVPIPSDCAKRLAASSAENLYLIGGSGAGESVLKVDLDSVLDIKAVPSMDGGEAVSQGVSGPAKSGDDGGGMGVSTGVRGAAVGDDGDDAMEDLVADLFRALHSEYGPAESSGCNSSCIVGGEMEGEGAGGSNSSCIVGGEMEGEGAGGSESSRNKVLRNY